MPGTEEYINGEEDVPILVEYSCDWEEHFFADLGTASAAIPDCPGEEEDQFDVEPPLPKITKYEDASYTYLST